MYKEVHLEPSLLLQQDVSMSRFSIQTHYKDFFFLPVGKVYKLEIRFCYIKWSLDSGYFFQNLYCE